MISMDGVMQAPGGPAEDPTQGFKFGGLGSTLRRWILAATGLFLVVSSSPAGAEQWPPEQTCCWPIADAGPPFAGARNTVLQLDGTLSRDPDPSTPLTFSWTQIAGPEVALTGADTPRPSFTVPDVPAGTELRFQLVVTDGFASDSAIAYITVIDMNHPPVANAGPNQSVMKYWEVTLNGTQSWDVDSTIFMTYTWVQLAGPAVTFESGNRDRWARFYVEPHIPDGTVFTFELTVNDGSVSSSDTVNIFVRDVLPPPVADAGPDQEVEERDEVVLDGTGSYDPDEEYLYYQWTQLAGPPVEGAVGTTVQPRFTAPEVETDTVLTFQLWISDGPYQRTDTVDVMVREVDHRPVAKAGPDQTVDERVRVTLDGSGSSDPDPGTNLLYAWEQVAGPAVTLLNARSARPTFTAPEVREATVLTFQLKVSDGVLSRTDTVDVTVRNVWRAPMTHAEGSL